MSKSRKKEYTPVDREKALYNKLKREALTLEELKKLSPEERKAYFDERRGIRGPSKRPKQFEKHRDPGAVERMMEFERTFREAGLDNSRMMDGGMARGKGNKMYQHNYATGGSVTDHLKSVPADNKGLGKLPKEVRNKMGYMSYGGMAKKKGK